MEQINRYQIQKEIGRGGMATVYLAFDPYFNRRVAVKVLPRQLTIDPKYINYFKQEAQTIAKLEHDAIVPVYDFGEHDDAPFLVMRYMAGGTLKDRLQGKPLALDEVFSILKRLAPAIDKAHAAGIIHRDIKPSNILYDDDGKVYLSDFGIARMADATGTLTMIGTPAYISPEQVIGTLLADGRADIYALGVVLFEMLTGQKPYPYDTTTKIQFAHVYEPVPDIRQLNPHLPAETQAVLDKVMAKDREDRYATAAELAAAVKTLTEARPAAEEPEIIPPEAVAEEEEEEEEVAPEVVDLDQVIAAPAEEVEEEDWELWEEEEEEEEADDLTVIKGIGLATEQKLNNAGIYTMGQLSTLSPEELSRIASVSELTAVSLIAQAKGREPVERIDDLTVIKGIGRKKEEQLNAFGIYTIDAIASTSPGKLAEIGSVGKATAKSWIAQAKGEVTVEPQLWMPQVEQPAASAVETPADGQAPAASDDFTNLGCAVGISALAARIGVIAWWLLRPERWYDTFSELPLYWWLWPVLGLIFVPWTTLVFLIVSSSGIVGWDWLWLGIAFLFDLVPWYYAAAEISVGTGFGCLFAAFSVLLTRIAGILWWIIDNLRWFEAFKHWPLLWWLWPVLGLLLLPWTTLAYVFVAPDGIIWSEWLIIAVGILLDASAWYIARDEWSYLW